MDAGEKPCRVATFVRPGVANARVAENRMISSGSASCTFIEAVGDTRGADNIDRWSGALAGKSIT